MVIILHNSSLSVNMTCLHVEDMQIPSVLGMSELWAAVQLLGGRGLSCSVSSPNLIAYPSILFPSFPPPPSPL